MRYDSFAYLYPPRPEKAVPPMLLSAYERMGWVGQVKMNGTNNVMFIAPDRSVRAMNRHAEAHKAWTPTADSTRLVKRLPGSGWWVLVGELLHSKVPGIRDTIYYHDVLVADGNYLLGKSYMDRLSILGEAFRIKHGDDRGHYVAMDERTWIAKIQTSGFRAMFESLSRPEEEGLVLKDPKAKLVACGRASANSAGQHKCRRPHENYGF